MLGWHCEMPSNSSSLVDFCSFLTWCSFSSSWCFFTHSTTHRSRLLIVESRRSESNMEWRKMHLLQICDPTVFVQLNRRVTRSTECEDTLEFVGLFMTLGEKVHFSSTRRFPSSVLTFCTNRTLGEKKICPPHEPGRKWEETMCDGKNYKIWFKNKLNASKLQRQKSSCASPRCSFEVETRSQKHFTPDLDKKKPRGGIYIRMSPPEEFVCNCEIMEWLKWRGRTSIITLISIKQCSSTQIVCMTRADDMTTWVLSFSFFFFFFRHHLG